MTQFPRGTTLFQKTSLALLLLAVGTLIVSYSAGGSQGPGWVILALIVCFIAFRRELLWRVRNRLLVTYFLFGVVPVMLIAFGLTLGGELLLGQFATERVRQSLNARIETVHSAARDLALAASQDGKANLLDGIRKSVPSLATVVRRDGGAALLPGSGEMQTVPAWIIPGFSGIFESNGRYFLGSNVREGDAEAFAYLPLDRGVLASLAPGVVSVPEVIRGNALTSFYFGLSGTRIFAEGRGGRQEIRPSGLPKTRSLWDLPVAALLPWTVQSSSGTVNIYLPLLSRPTLLLAGVPTGRMSAIALSMLATTGAFFLLVEALSLFSTLRLSRAITVSADNLYRGTLQVGQGDFSHQIPVQGGHQLSELARSFNTMTAKVRQLIVEVKKKEKLDAELEIAREVQLSLFPKSAPKLKSLEIAGVCIPGRVVSGDYYDYASLDDRRTAIALGDVSGKGMSAALLVSSIQSALHAQMKSGGASPRPEFPTAAFVELLNEQLYENTPAEKYATFFLSVYDDETGRLSYTNAGHLTPILVRDGKAISVEGGGMVVGLLSGAKYEQQDVMLQTGDLVAIFSDGIPEAMDREQQEFGDARLAEVLVAQASKPLDGIITEVTGTVEKWIHDPEGRDDLTLVLLRKL